MMNFNYGFPLAFVCLFTQTLQAQTPDQTIRPSNVKIASPNAAALGKVADVPIGYHTGTPNIDIPIYTVQEGPLQMPISLSYHASGLKVMEQSSWVGAGWSLNAGGMITRSVRGMPDEILSSSGSPTPISYLNNGGYYNYLFMDNPAEYSPQIVPNNPLTGTPQILAHYEFAVGRRDGEADMFNFNFNGYSGKFYFRPDKSVVLAPQQDIKVTPLFCQGTNCSTTNEYLYGWIVTTPDGVKYYFGKVLAQAGNYNTTDNAIPLEYTTSYSATSGISYNKTPSSWFLNKIESPDSKFSISLVYSAENYSYYTISLSPTPSFGSAIQGIDLVKNIMIGLRLNAIKFSNNGLVSFVPSTFMRRDLSSSTTNLTDFDADSTRGDSPRALGEIRISNSPTTTFCQSFAFSYGYFNDATHGLTGYLSGLENSYSLHSDKKRLKLKSITEKSCDASVIKPPHTFTYFEESSVPRTLSFAQDHWGFYNGATSNPSMLPPISIDNGLTNLSATYGNRDSKWPEMRAGTLQKITYPTGGFSRFAFESHDVFIPVTLYDSIYIGNKSANYTQTSGVTTFTVNATTTMKARVSFQNSPPNTAQGNIHIKNTTTLADVGPGATPGLKIFTIPAGTYDFSVQSTSNNASALMCVLYKVVPKYTQQQDVVVGGLRIDSLFYNDGINTAQKVQLFDYVDENGAAQGVLFSRPAYVSLVKNYTIKEHGGIPMSVAYQSSPYIAVNGCIAATGDPGAPTNFLFYVSANAILPMVTSQGNHFGYNYVKVTESDGGYTVYKFKISGNPSSDVCLRVLDQNDCNDFLPNYPPAPDPYKPDRGELAGKYVYNAGGALLYKEIYTNDYQPETVGVTGLIVKSYSSNDYLFPTEYEWKSSKKIKTTVETYMYDSSYPAGAPAYKKSETYFGSNRHTQATKSVVSDASAAVLHEVRNTYTADVIVPACPDLETGLASIDATLVSDVASVQSTYNTASCGTTSNCRLQVWLLYTYNANIKRKTNVASRGALIGNYKTCMTGTTGTWPWTSASADLKAIVKLKNRNQISIIENSKWRNGQFMESAYVTYQGLLGDSVFIYPIKYETIKVPAPLASTGFAPVTATSTAITKDSKYALEETYVYEKGSLADVNGNILEVTGKNGVPTSYIWGYSNTLPVVMAVGATYSALSNAYINYPATIRTVLPNAMITTYTHDPLIGMTTQTDPNGVVTTYGYDPLARLLFTKDKDGNIVQKLEYNYNAH